MDTSARLPFVILPIARQRPRPDAEIAFGGEVSRPSSQEVAKGLAGYQSFSSMRSDRMIAVGAKEARWSCLGRPPFRGAAEMDRWGTKGLSS